MLQLSHRYFSFIFLRLRLRNLTHMFCVLQLLDSELQNIYSQLNIKLRLLPSLIYTGNHLQCTIVLIYINIIIGCVVSEVALYQQVLFIYFFVSEVTFVVHRNVIKRELYRLKKEDYTSVDINIRV